MVLLLYTNIEFIMCTAHTQMTRSNFSCHCVSLSIGCRSYFVSECMCVCVVSMNVTKWFHLVFALYSIVQIRTYNGHASNWKMKFHGPMRVWVHTSAYVLFVIKHFRLFRVFFFFFLGRLTICGVFFHFDRCYICLNGPVTSQSHRYAIHQVVLIPDIIWRVMLMDGVMKAGIAIIPNVFATTTQKFNVSISYCLF